MNWGTAVEWIREVSLVRRVMIGFWVMATVVGVLGASAIWSLQNRAAALQHAAMGGAAGTASKTEAEWVIGLIILAVVVFALLACLAGRGGGGGAGGAAGRGGARGAGGGLE